MRTAEEAGSRAKTGLARNEPAPITAAETLQMIALEGEQLAADDKPHLDWKVSHRRGE